MGACHLFNVMRPLHIKICLYGGIFYRFLRLSQMRWCFPIAVLKWFYGFNLKYAFWDSCRLKHPKFFTFTYGLRFFWCHASKPWDLLPHQVKNTDDIDIFKRNITDWRHSKQCSSLDIFLLQHELFVFYELPNIRSWLLTQNDAIEMLLRDTVFKCSIGLSKQY